MAAKDRLFGPGTASPRRVTAELGRRNQEHDAQDEHAGHDRPSTFEAVDRGIDDLNESNDRKELAQCPLGANGK